MRKQSKIIFYAGIVLGVAAVLTGVALSGGEKIPKDFTVSYDGIKTADITAGVSVHDPSVIEADGTYYIFGSHMSGASSGHRSVTDIRSRIRSLMICLEQSMYLIIREAETL